MNEDLGEALYHLARLHARRGDSLKAAECLSELVALTKDRRGPRGKVRSNHRFKL